MTGSTKSGSTISGSRSTSERFNALCRAGRSELERTLRAGVQPSAQSLSGWEFRGYNTQLVTHLLRIRKFKKGFTSDQANTLRGYNVRVKQNRLDEPWIAVFRQSDVSRHGFFDAAAVDLDAADNYIPHALLLNYECGRNPALDPSRILRDYLVQVTPDNTDLLLGKAYGAIGHRRIPLGFFVLERHNRIV